MLNFCVHSKVLTPGSAIDTLEIDSLSQCEYWNLARTTGTSNVYLTLGWNNASCNLTADSSDMRLAYWNENKWIKKGDPYTATTVKSTAAISSFGDFTLAQNACYPYKHITLSISSPTGVCIGRSIVLDATPSVATPTPSYVWNTSATTKSITVSPSTNTGYTVTATYRNGCTKTASKTILAYNDNHYFDASGFDTIVAPDTVFYRIVSAGLDQTIRAYNEQSYCINVPVSGYTPVDVYFSSKAFTDTLHLQYDIDSLGTITGARLINYNNIEALDPALFTISGQKHIAIASKIILVEVLTRYYYKLKKELDGGFYIAKNKQINFLYDEEYNSGEALTYRILNSKRIPLSSLPSKTRKFGINQYSVALPSTTPSGIYYLEVTNAKGENYYLRFKLM